jgi:hypothetical protein
VSVTPNVTDWIIAVAAVFAAVGTVGAVIVALWQSARRDRRSLKIDIVGMGIAGDPTPYTRVKVLNDGYRPVRVDFPPTLVAPAAEGHTVAVSEGRVEEMSDRLPRQLEEGEMASFVWNANEVRELARARGWEKFLHVQISDAHGNQFTTPFPGVKFLPKRPWRREARYERMKNNKAVRYPGEALAEPPKPSGGQSGA